MWVVPDDRFREVPKGIFVSFAEKVSMEERKKTQNKMEIVKCDARFAD